MIRIFKALMIVVIVVNSYSFGQEFSQESKQNFTSYQEMMSACAVESSLGTGNVNILLDEYFYDIGISGDISSFKLFSGLLYMGEMQTGSIKVLNYGTGDVTSIKVSESDWFPGSLNILGLNEMYIADVYSMIIYNCKDGEITKGKYYYSTRSMYIDEDYYIFSSSQVYPACVHMFGKVLITYDKGANTKNISGVYQ